MRRRKEKNSALFRVALVLMAWLVALSLVPVAAHAVQIDDDYPVLVNTVPSISPVGQPLGYQICPIETYDATNPAAVMQNRAEWGFIKRVVYCVQGLVIPATYRILYVNTLYYIYQPIAAAMVLAVMAWGVMMVTGKNSAPMRDAFIVAVKIGSVSFFTYVMGQSSIWPYGLFPVIISIVDELAGIVTTYIGHSTTMRCAANLATADIWGRVDCALNHLLGGVFSSDKLVAGLIGFLISAFVSGTFGLFIALFGFAVIFILVFTILRATYITISAYIALALMAIVSPIFITLILFKSTYGYFEKWLKLTIGFMLQPLFLFAYLSMLLAAFDTVVYDGPYSIHRALIGPAYIGAYPNPLATYPNNNQLNPDGEFQTGRWVYDSGFYRQVSAASAGVGVNPRLQRVVESNVTGIMGSTMVEGLPKSDFLRRDAAGMLMNILDTRFSAINVYKIDIPVYRVAWRDLALSHRCTQAGCTAQSEYNRVVGPICAGNCNDDEAAQADAALRNIEINYMVQLVLSILMAMLTMYLFYIMLDALPFIGAGMGGGDKTSMPVLGSNGLSMPGSSLVQKAKAGFGKLAGGGGGGGGG